MLYFDYAATTPSYYNGNGCSDYWFNANAQYKAGLNSKKALEITRADIKKILKLNSGYIVFGPSASLLTSIIIDRFNEVMNSKHYVFASYFEHESVFDKARDFFIDYNDLEEKLPEEGTFLACLMHVNNITGCVHCDKNFYEKVHNKNGFVFMDATATFGHWYSDRLDECCDCFVCSAHKFYGEKGLGFAWLSDSFGWFLGLDKDSHNEYGLIPGTPNVESIIMMQTALYYNTGAIETRLKYFENNLNIFIEELNKNDIKCRCFNYPEKEFKKSCAINTIIFENIKADALIQFLSNKSIYISAAHSACAENDDYRVLNAYGITDEEAQRAVRISFSYLNTTAKEIKDLVSAIIEFYNLFI